MKKSVDSSICKYTKGRSLLQKFFLAAMLTALIACQLPSPPQSGGSSGSPPSSGTSGTPGTPGLPGTPGTPGTPGLPGTPESSGSEDSIGDLDQSLDDSLDDFDSTVSDQGSSDQPAQIDILSPSGGGIESDSDQPPYETAESIAESDAGIEDRAAAGPESKDDGDGAKGQPSGNNSSAPSEAIEAQPIPDDLGDGQGDNIVLRQIRDAASQESDPILRERLWDEYRRIKNGN